MNGTSLKRKLGAFDAAMIVSGAIIGSGIFINSAESAKFLQTSSQLLLVWMLGGVIAFLGGLCFAELGAMFPQTGGQVVYLEKAFSPWVGFLFGWTLFSTIQTGAIAAVAYACASFISVFLPLGRGGTVVLAAAIIWLLSLVNLLGIRPGSIVQNVFTTLKIAALLVLIGYGLFWQRPAPLDWGALFPHGFNLGVLSVLGLALMPALFSYGGWQNLRGEEPFPEHSAGHHLRGHAGGHRLCVFEYRLCQSPPGRGDRGLNPAGLRRHAGHGGSSGRIFHLYGHCHLDFWHHQCVHHDRSAGVLCHGQREHVPPSRLHPRYGTPHYSIFLQSLWASALLLTNSYGQLLQYVTFGDWIFFGLTALALLVLRRKLPAVERPYRTWGYPVVPLVFSAISIAVVLNVIISAPLKSAVGSIIILGGLPIYAFFRRRERSDAP